MSQSFNGTTSHNIDIVKKYQGEIVTDTYLNENPEILAKLPSKEAFSIEYLKLKGQTSKGRVSLLEMSEMGIATAVDYR